MALSACGTGVGGGILGGLPRAGLLLQAEGAGPMCAGALEVQRRAECAALVGDLRAANQH